ncbi:MAG: sodium/calcium exchanger protein [Candidatus Moduliflexus flocculans]|nr:sodium/calcium exchanger protein [Candidatus Moduliflexus flocculans]
MSKIGVTAVMAAAEMYGILAGRFRHDRVLGQHSRGGIDHPRPGRELACQGGLAPCHWPPASRARHRAHRSSPSGRARPELAVSVAAAYSGSSALSVANVVGGNIFQCSLHIGGLGPDRASSPSTASSSGFDVPGPDRGVGPPLRARGRRISIGFLDSLLLAGLVIAYTVYLIVEARRGRGRVSGGVGAGSSRSRAPPPPERMAARPELWRLIAAGIAGTRPRLPSARPGGQLAWPGPSASARSSSG